MHFPRTDPMSFLNLRISGRLYAGFGALLLFCAGLAGFAVWQLETIQVQVRDLSVQSENAIRVGEISIQLHALRRAILRYNFDQDAASFAEAEKRLGTATDLLGEAIKTTSSEKNRSIYAAVAKNVEELKTKHVALGDAMK